MDAADGKKNAATATQGTVSRYANPGELTRKQVGIWLPIGMVLITIAAVYAIYGIDDVKNRDTILYAKFIANLKDKQN